MNTPLTVDRVRGRADLTRYRFASEFESRREYRAAGLDLRAADDAEIRVGLSPGQKVIREARIRIIGVEVVERIRTY